MAQDIDVQAHMKQRFATFKKIMDESGEQKAWDTCFEGYPERQKKMMGQFIDNNTLAGGFSAAVPFFKQIGMDMEVVDISTDDQDAVLEIQKLCPVLDVAREHGFEKPCRIICEMDVAATKEAFENMKGDVLARIADGHCICIFKYERPKK
jgi:predicted ArsR family transcriptional regulator